MNACRVCRGPAGRGGVVCFACRVVGRRLGLPLARVLPVRLCPLPGPLYTVLKGYKESPVREARDRFAPMVHALFGAFLADHAHCVTALADGPIDAVLPVPSSRRPVGSPLSSIGGLAAAACRPFPDARWEPGLLARGRGAVGHMHPHPDAFAVPAPTRASLRGRRVALLDDTYVSGARAQSAAAALRTAGAVTVIVAAGRVLRPDRVRAHAAYLADLGTGADTPAADAAATVVGPQAPRCWRCAHGAAGKE